MIAEIQAYVRALDEIERDFDSIILDLVRDHEKEVLAMNTDDQLFEGKDAENRTLKPPYSQGYKRFKRSRGLPTDRVTTRLDGDYHESFFITYGTDEFTIDAKDFKKPFLEKRYGSNLSGLTDDNIDKLSALLAPELLEVIRRRLLK